MKKIIYFVDIKCKQPYTFATMSERAIGGTESTLLRVADRLSDEYEICHVQPCRQKDEVDERGIHYLTMESARRRAADAMPHHVVVIRKIKALLDLADWFQRRSYTYGYRTCL